MLWYYHESELFVQSPSNWAATYLAASTLATTREGAPASPRSQSGGCVMQGREGRVPKEEQGAPLVKMGLHLKAGSEN